MLTLFIASLLYLLCFKHVDNLGAYSTPSETGLLIPSVNVSRTNRLLRGQKTGERSLEGVRIRIMRYQSSVMIGNIPVISVAFGPDAQSNQNRGRAVGFVAIGDVAVGIIAVGAIAAGVIAVGGLGFGVISVGGLALGLVALGGLAVGGVAVGGVAAGLRSLGGVAIGPHPYGGLPVYWPTS